MRGWIAPIAISTLLSISFVWYLVQLAPEVREPHPLRPTAPKILEPAKPIRDVTPDAILQGPKLEEGLLERLPAVVPPPLPPQRTHKEKLQRPIVLAAGVITIGKRKIILADIDPVGLDEACTDHEGIEWPCGRFARTEMQRFVRGRPIDCDATDQNTSTVTTRCRLASYDMSAWLVLTGWARPKGDHFSEELAKAKSGERGIWRKTPP